jgi:hypothetical protein
LEIGLSEKRAVLMTLRLVIVPGIITLAVTILRLIPDEAWQNLLQNPEKLEINNGLPSEV